MVGRSGAAEKLGELARLVEGRLIGDPEIEVSGLAGLAEAGPDEISFLANPRYASLAATTRAAAVLVAEELPGLAAAQIVHPQPQLAFAQLLARFHPPRRLPPGVHPAASLAPDVTLGREVHVGAQAVIEAGAVIGDRAVIEALAYVGPGCRIGADSWLEPLACLLAGTELGERVIIHSGSVLGGDGFGFVWDGRRHAKVPQVGRVVIEDDVEIGAGCTIDRAVLGATRIGRGTKTDNQVHVAHNVQVGEHCLLVAQVGISGSAVLGDRVTLAGQTGVAGHVSIGAGTTITGRGGVTHSVGPGLIMSGYPVIEHRRWLRAATAFGRLPDLMARIRELEQRLQAMEGKVSP